MFVLQFANAQKAYYSYNNKYNEPKIVFDIALSGGGMNMITDIGGNTKVSKGSLSSITFKNTNVATGISVTGTYNDLIAGRLEFTSGTIEGADSMLKNLSGNELDARIERNLSFKTSIKEINFSVELHPLFLFEYTNSQPPRWSPYILGGIGWLSFNPQAKLDNTWVDLAPLRLEGQGFTEYPDRKPYRKNAISFPLGLGIRYEASPYFFLRAEICGRLTNTDYLDDVSEGPYINPDLFFKYLSVSDAAQAVQLFNRSADVEESYLHSRRGNPKQKDIFWTVMLKAGFILNRKKI